VWLASQSWLSIWFVPMNASVMAFWPRNPKFRENFWTRKFILLSRGTRDSFCVKDFHSRGDGHSNILALLLDTSEKVFGGFTEVKLDSTSDGKRCHKIPSFELSFWKVNMSLNTELHKIFGILSQTKMAVKLSS
jgi:hypothetical protein